MRWRGCHAERPTIPKEHVLKDLSAERVTELARVAQQWYAEAGRREAAKRIAGTTRAFLVNNYHSVSDKGELDRKQPWWPRHHHPEVTDPAAIDLRGVRMRQRALSFGLAHFLGKLYEEEQVPEGTKSHIDDVTNLASLRMHERLMEEDFERLDPSINIEKLKPVYLYKKGNKAEILYGRLVKMELIGLWCATAPMEGLSWQIRIGPIAKIFHLNAYFPAISKLSKLAELQVPQADSDEPRVG